MFFKSSWFKHCLKLFVYHVYKIISYLYIICWDKKLSQSDMIWLPNNILKNCSYTYMKINWENWKSPNNFVHCLYDYIFIVGTIVLRLCMFPLVIKSQKNVINMANHMPTVQRLQEKMTEAKQRGDMLGGKFIVKISYFNKHMHCYKMYM